MTVATGLLGLGTDAHRYLGRRPVQHAQQKVIGVDGAYPVRQAISREVAQILGNDSGRTATNRGRDHMAVIWIW